MVKKFVGRIVVPFTVSALFLFGCADKGERALLEIDFSDVSNWKYLLGANIYGEAEADTVDRNFSGSLRAYVQGLPASEDGKTRFGLKDVTLIAPFFGEEEKDSIEQRLSALEMIVNENNVTLSDTIGIPGVLTGGWDIMRCITRVMPVMPNAEMKVGTSWEREQRFPMALEDGGQADGLLYQLFTLDSVYKTATGASTAAFSWVFSYRVSTPGDGGAGTRTPLSGTGRGTGILDIDRKALIKSQASFQVTHSQRGNSELNEVVHFEMVE